MYTKYEPWNSASFYSGEMEFEVGGKDFGLERNFYHREKQTTLISRQDGELLSEEYGDLQMLLGGLNKEMYEILYSAGGSGSGKRTCRVRAELHGKCGRDRRWNTSTQSGIGADP